MLTPLKSEEKVISSNLGKTRKIDCLKYLSKLFSVKNGEPKK